MDTFLTVLSFSWKFLLLIFIPLGIGLVLIQLLEKINNYITNRCEDPRPLKNEICDLQQDVGYYKSELEKQKRTFKSYVKNNRKG